MFSPTNVSDADTIFSSSWKNVPVTGISSEFAAADERQISCIHIRGNMEFLLTGKKEGAYCAAAILHMDQHRWHDPVATFRAFTLLDEVSEVNDKSVGYLLGLGYGCATFVETEVSRYMDPVRYRAIMLSLPSNLENVLQKLRLAAFHYSLDGLIAEVDANRLPVTNMLRSFGIDRKEIIDERYTRLKNSVTQYRQAFRRLFPDLQSDDQKRITRYAVDLLLKGVTEGAEIVAGACMRLRYSQRLSSGTTILHLGDATLFMRAQGSHSVDDDIANSVALSVSRIFEGVDPRALATTLIHLRDNVHLMPIIAT